MNFSLRSVYSAFVALASIALVPLRADNMASIAINPATGAVTLSPQWAIGSNLAGFHYMAQDLSLGGGASQFYSIKATTIPSGGDITAFVHYIAASGAATAHADIGSKLTPNSYSALTSADPNVGFGAVNFYLIHHAIGTDYFTAIIPGSGTASAVTDLKPMSGPGGPGTLGGTGYFGLTFSATDLNYGANLFYYLRTDPVTGNTKFGDLVPALLSTSTDLFDLGQSGFNALTFSSTDVGYGADKMFYDRLDPITGFTILGTLDPGTGKVSDIANLGSVYSTLDFVSGDVGFGTPRFYTTGAINLTGQTVSFAAQINRTIVGGPFTVAPSASSALPIVLTVVPGSIGAASISAPVGGVFTITPTAPGLITLQATQAGQTLPTAYEYNMLRQSFTITGVAALAIATQPISQSAVAGTTATFAVVASGTSTLSYQWQKNAVNISSANASATTATLSLPSVSSADVASYDVVVTDLSGSITSSPVLLTLTTAAPIITNATLTAAGSVGSSFSYAIAASGSPTSYSAAPLPAGLSIVPGTGIISGIPTATGITNVILGATNPSGTGNATLVITVAPPGVAPIITNLPLAVGGTLSTPFTFTIVASGSPTSYTAGVLPAGLSFNPATGTISGTPTAIGTFTVALGATNATGTGTATLTITVAAVGVAPVIVNPILSAAGNVGTPLGYTIIASGSPATYSATGLPPGLSLVALTGAITGTPTVAGTSLVTLGATNAFGTGNATLSITVAAAFTAPVIANNPLVAAGIVGQPFTFLIVATGFPTTYSLAPLPPGLSMFGYSGAITGTPTTAGTTPIVITATNAYGSSSATLVVTIAAAAVAPVITNPAATVTGTIGSPFSFPIGATGFPTLYGAAPLPAGLTLNTVTGVISGMPTTTGTTVVVVTAHNTSGTSTSSLTITVGAAIVAPVITSPTTAIGVAGTAFPPYQIATIGSATSYSAVGLPPGLALNSSTGVITGMGTVPGVYVVTLSATNAAGTTTSSLTITIGAAIAAPIITSPTTATGVAGTSFPPYQIATSASATSYTAIGLPPGLTLNPTTGAITGTATLSGVYIATLSATNSAGTATTTLTFTVAAAPFSRIVNFSLRAFSGPGSQSLAMGFILSGDGKNLLLRGIGPTLANFGVTGFLADPMLTLYSGNTVIGFNDNWGTSSTGASQGAQLAATELSVGAFALPAGSLDSALMTTLNHGAYTVGVLGSNSTSGTALAEVYDTDSNLAARLINVSARMTVGTGNDALLAGFVIAGNTPKTVLIRGVGPTLANFGVVGAMADPQLTVFQNGVQIAANDNWGVGTSTVAQITAASAQVGAFPLPAGSLDSALIITLQPGMYSVQLSGSSGPTGIALIEIYDVM